MKKEKETLSIEKEVAFPLYAAAKEVLRACQPELSELGLTYTQYLVMTVIWEWKKLNLKMIGEKLFFRFWYINSVIAKIRVKRFDYP